MKAQKQKRQIRKKLSAPYQYLAIQKRGKKGGQSTVDVGDKAERIATDKGLTTYQPLKAIEKGWGPWVCGSRGKTLAFG